jgi:quinol monooxygenase YgiN
MQSEILTEVTAFVPEDRATVVVEAYEELLRSPLPDGLLRTELLRGAEGEWRIQSLWRDRAALDAMRAAPEPAAAPALFGRLGADPVLRVYAVEMSHQA